MTNKEYLISQLGFAPSNNNLIEGAITDAALVDTDIYVLGNKIALKTAAVAALQILLSTADTAQGVGETRNEIKYDRAAILKRIAMLEGELGLSTGAVIRRVSKW